MTLSLRYVEIYTIRLQWKFLNCCAFAKEDKLYVSVIFETTYVPHIVNLYTYCTVHVFNYM